MSTPAKKAAVSNRTSRGAGRSDAQRNVSSSLPSVTEFSQSVLKGKSRPTEMRRTVNPNAKSGEFGQIVQDMKTGEENFTASQAKLDLGGRKLNVPTQGAQQNVDGGLAVDTQEGLDAYNSAESILELLNAKQLEINAAKQNEQESTRAAYDQSYEVTGIAVDMNPKYEAAVKNAQTAKAKREELEKEYSDLLAWYYPAENQEKQASIRADSSMLRQYTSAQDLQSDLEKVAYMMNAYYTGENGKTVREYKTYLTGKYGLDDRTFRYAPDLSVRGSTSLQQLYDDLNARAENAIFTLEEGGYNYDRMTGYEQMRKDAEEYRIKTAQLEQKAKEMPAAASAMSVLAVPGQGVDFARLFLGNLGHNDPSDPENYVPLNVYNMDATNFVSTIRGTVSREIEENTNWELFGQNVASFLYNTGMSVADSAVQVGTLGSAATLFMGASAASNQAKSIIERGGTNDQAFWGGLAAGAAETVFEKVSIDKLLSTKSVTGWKSWVKETAKQAGVEASEESLTEIAHLLSDAAVMGGKSDFALAAARYQAQGMSADAAKRRAFLDCVGQVAWAGVGGALSGGIMGGSVSGFNYAASGGVQAQNKTVSTGEAGRYRAETPQNVELPTVPIINLSMQDVAEMNGGVPPQAGNVLRKDAISRARSRLGLDQNSEVYIPASNVLRNGEEYVLKITRSSLNKMLSPSNGGIVSPESIVVLENIERIANNGVYFKSEGDRQGRDQIAGYDHLMTTVYIDNQPYVVDMRVRVYDALSGGGNRLYYFTPEEIVTAKKIGANLPTGTLHERTMSQETAPTIATTIPHPEQGVNARSAQNSDGVFLPGETLSAEDLQKELKAVWKQRALEELNAAYEKNVGAVPLPFGGLDASRQAHYAEWLKSIGAQGTELNTLAKYNEAKYNNSPAYQLLSGYSRAIEKGDVSPLVGFAKYEQTSKLLQKEVVGVTTVTGVGIESFATHFIDRVIGQTSTAHSNMRCGVPVSDAIDALQNPLKVGPIRTTEDGDTRQMFFGAKAAVTVSLRDRRLIQTNPRGE